MKAETPTKPNDGEFDQHQPAAARKQIAADFASLSLHAVQKRRYAGEKNKRRRAEMCDPTRQEQRRVGDIARVKSSRGEKVARMVERHYHHDEATQKIDG